MTTLSQKAINQYLNSADRLLAKAAETSSPVDRHRWLRRAAEVYRRCGWGSEAARVEIEAANLLD